MSLINSLENRHGRHAVPGLVAYIAWFQVAVWVLMQFRPEFPEMLYLNRSLVLQGEVWRLVTWAFIPGTNSPVWLLLGALLMMTISETLDHAWGPFKVNVYVFGGMLLMNVGAMVFRHSPVGLTLDASIFFAFAAIVPNYEIWVFFILPVKVKWLAAITGALLFLDFIDTPFMRLPILFSQLNFFIAFGPTFLRWARLRGVVTARRARFDAAKAPEGAWLHKCHACGKTDLDDPKLEFRVGADGEDYCSTCRPKKTAPQG